jgi:3-dehydroquinate synthase
LKPLKVILGKRTYPINIGSGIIQKDNIFFPLKSGNQAMLVTNKTLANLFKDQILFYLRKSGIQIDHIIISDGEQYKTLNEMELVISALLEKQHTRDTTLIALGGGVIGDLTGFVASIYQRGVSFIQIPTTLLAQVDASIGGKTSVNHLLGKNMIGSFWQPSSVIIDIDFLTTLPRNQLISGIAEVIKYAIIFDKEFFYWLEDNIENILSLNHDPVFYCIQKCCEFKSKLVSSDEREKNLRSLLNLGHTYGHAIEAHTGYGSWLHGEAISVGMVMAARTSKKLGYLKESDFIRIVNLLKRSCLPITGPKNMSASSYIPYMMRDKKVISGDIRLVLPLSIGKVKVYRNIEKNVILSAIKDSQ